MNDKIQDLVNQLSTKKPPPPPTKMQVDEYNQLLTELKNSDPKRHQEVLNALQQYNEELEQSAGKLADKLKMIYKM